MAKISAKVVAAIVITVLIFGGILTYLIYRSTRSNHTDPVDPLSIDTDPVDPPDPTICGVVDIATVTASSTLNAGHMAENLFDGDPTTSWHSAVDMYTPHFAFENFALAQPNDLLRPDGPDTKVGQWVTCRLLRPSTISAYTMWPRSNHPGTPHQHVGHPKLWTIVVSDDGSTWRGVHTHGVNRWTAETRVQLPEPIVDATYIGIVVHAVSTKGEWRTSSIFTAIQTGTITPTWCAFNGLDFHCT